MNSLTRLLWTPSHNRLVIPSALAPDTALGRLTAALAENGEFLGKVNQRAFKLWRARRYAHSRNTFAPILYGVIVPDEGGSLMIGHFQLNPVMRLFLIVWFVVTSLLALGLIITGFLNATADATARDALPFLLPALLPLLGWLLLRWQQGRGRADERAMRAWVENIVRSA